MRSHTTENLQKILDNPSLSLRSKIDQVMELQMEARAIQRAATEGGMDPDDGLNEDLRDIELALEQLGTISDNTGAATL